MHRGLTLSLCMANIPQACSPPRPSPPALWLSAFPLLLSCPLTPTLQASLFLELRAPSGHSSQYSHIHSSIQNASKHPSTPFTSPSVREGDQTQVVFNLITKEILNLLTSIQICTSLIGTHGGRMANLSSISPFSQRCLACCCYSANGNFPTEQRCLGPAQKETMINPPCPERGTTLQGSVIQGCRSRATAAFCHAARMWKVSDHV